MRLSSNAEETRDRLVRHRNHTPLAGLFKVVSGRGAQGEPADYSPVGLHGHPAAGYAIWELIQQALDKRIKATGHVNVLSAVHSRAF
jgi:hypothetical protein